MSKLINLSHSQIILFLITPPNKQTTNKNPNKQDQITLTLRRKRPETGHQILKQLTPAPDLGFHIDTWVEVGVGGALALGI